jgi:hypothetical protein
VEQVGAEGGAEALLAILVDGGIIEQRELDSPS